MQLDLYTISDTIPFLCSLKNCCQHTGVRDVGISCHFCKVSVPAPARVRIYFKQFRPAFGVKSPVKASIVTAAQPCKESKAAPHNFFFCFFSKSRGHGFDIPVGGIGKPFSFIPADLWKFFRNFGVVFFRDRQYGARRRVSDDTNTDVFSRKEFLQQERLI